MIKGKVLQEWVEELPWKQQSVLLSSLRGPDNFYFLNLKKLGRWIRSATQNNADFSSDYMKHEQLPSIDEIKKEAEYCSVHYLNHFLQGLEIIGYNHPDSNFSNIANKYYNQLVTQVLHLNPESKFQLEARLKDRH